MNQIPGVSYPITQGVKDQLSGLPRLACRIPLPESGRCDREVVRLLGNAHYGHVRELLEFLDNSASVAGVLVDKVLKKTDPMEFRGALAELYLFCHFAHRMPNRVRPATGLKSDKHPDMIVAADGLDVAVEVYGPMNLFGFQLVTSYAKWVLKYLEIDRGYDLIVRVEPGTEHDPFYAYQFETEREIRPWLREFAAAVTSWLSDPTPQRVFRKEGPSPSVWTLSVAIESLHQDRQHREITQRIPGRSDDPRLHFEVGTVETTADGWWGRSVKKKLAERQAGDGPRDGLLRLLVVDFARLDTGFPDFICWPRIAERIDTSIRLLVSKIGGQLPYDVVLPARLGLSCCSGTPVWLGEARTEIGQSFFDLAGLTVPCKAPRVDDVDWASLLTE